MGGGDAPQVQETEQDKALSEVVWKQWDRYKTAFKPVEDEYLKDLHKTPADEAQVTGQVAAGIGKEFDMARSGTERDIFSAGVRPESGKFKAAIGGLGIDEGTVKSAAMTRGAQAVDDQTIINLQNAVNMGRGEAVEATRDMSTLAREATGEAISNAFAESDKSDTINSSIASAAGMGLAGWKGMKEKKEA